MDMPAAPLKLVSLGGEEVPPDLVTDLLRLLKMPREALEKFWQALGPCLEQVISADTEKLLDMFCAAYRIDDDDLARAIKACRFFIQTAAKFNVPPHVLAADLDRLCPDAPVIKELLLAGYEPAKEHIRKEMVKAALVDHGKVLTGAQWRVDLVDSTERGALLLTPVAMLTLHYREGNDTGRITLQALPDMMAELRSICDSILSDGRNKGSQTTEESTQ